MSKELQQRYLDSVNYLDDNFAYFLTHVLNIGKPQQTRGVPTAAVSVMPWDDEDKDFAFLFNLDFARTLSTEEMAFVLGHETMHILLNHLKLCKRDEFSWSPKCTENCKQRWKKYAADPDRKGESRCENCSRTIKKFNIAADCVINDYLVNMGMELPKVPLMTGSEVVGYNCAYTTVAEVFNDISDEFVDEHGDGEGGSVVSGEYQQIDDHSWMRSSGKDEEEAAEAASADNPNMPGDVERKKQEDEDKFQSNLNPGKGATSASEFSEVSGVGLRWAALLEKINPFVFKNGPKPKPTWTRQPRKLAALRGTRLPVYKRGDHGIGGKKPALVMAIDTSGSIGDEEANLFINLARSVPQQHVKLFTCTFTDRYMELDLDEPEWQSGGTHFDAISSYIEDVVMPQNYKRYPNAVVVISDGYATFSHKRPEGKQEDAWWWLLTTDVNRLWGGGEDFPGHIERLMDYRKDLR